MKKKTLIILGGILFMTAITGCNSESRKEIEARFEGFVSLYPTNNLMDFYDKEGDRNHGFDENDKGTWIVRTSINRNQNDGLDTEGMVLRFNRNTRQATGNYFISTFSQKHGNTEIEYPVYYDEMGIHLMEDIEDEEVMDKIHKFKFLVEYISFENGYIQSLTLLDKRFNANVPLYNLTYQLISEDMNIEKIRQQYDIDVDLQELPRLRFEGTGEGQWGHYNRRNVEFLIDEERSVYVDGSVSFGNSEGMRD